jgi:hypothetical protein
MSKPCVSEFGIVQKDSLFSNAYVTSTTTVCKGTSVQVNGNVQINGNVVILEEKKTENATYSIRPSRAKSVYIFNAPLTHNTTITFSVDNSQSQVGDQMVWMFKNAQKSEITLAGLDTPTFYFSLGGTLTNEYTIPARDSVYGHSKYAQYWSFDGTSWIYSSDGR